MDSEKKSFKDQLKPPAGTTDAVRELLASVTDIIRAEMRLARAELRETGAFYGKHAARLGIFAGIAVLAGFPFMAFLCVGLGELIGNYWLSCLIVSVVMFAVGGIAGYAALRKMLSREVLFPHTRQTLELEKDVLVRESRSIATLGEKERRAA